MRFFNSPKPELKPRNPSRAWKLLPDIWELIKPRRGILAIGFVLMAINRVCGLILPGSAKYLYDDVLIQRRVHLLLPIVLIVVGAEPKTQITFVVQRDSRMPLYSKCRKS